MNNAVRSAVFPGSFDPVTLGHTDVIQRGLAFFDEIIVAVGTNTSKKYMYPAEKRLEMVQKTFAGEDRIRVKAFTGLTVDFCTAEGAGYLLRGLRNGIDFEYEESIAAMNHKLQPKVETVLLFSSTGVAYISSTIVREIIKNKGDVSNFVPRPVIQALKASS